MTQPQDPLPKVHPFVERKTRPLKKRVDTRGLLSLATLIVSLGALTVSMGGGAKLIADIFSDGLLNSLDGLWAKVIALGIAYLFGWGVALVSIRGFGNLIYPLIIKIYAWTCLAAVGILYIKVIQKLYVQAYDGVRFWAYLLMLLGGLIVLLGLHLLIEGHDLRPFAIPLLIISVLQLLVLVYRYVFTTDVNTGKLWADLTISIAMISISGLMLMHLGVFSPVREQINSWFRHNGNGNGKDDEGQHWVR